MISPTCLCVDASRVQKAGLIISSGDPSNSATPILQFLTEVYEDDLNLGTPYTNLPTYSNTDKAIISNTSVRPVKIPAPPSNRAYVSPVPEAVTADMEVVLVMCTVALLKRLCLVPYYACAGACVSLSPTGMSVWLFAGCFHES